MCGIAGIVGRPGVAGATAPGRVATMATTLAHRGPDDAGTWTDGTAALGSRRLAILDLSDAGHQPMRSRDGRLTLVYNGEVYNYLELRRELGATAFETDTDTEVVLRAYERWGPACVSRLNGMFAFAVWDARAQRLFCARDRFGEKPLVYCAQDGALLFGSEVKALAAAGVRLEPDLATWRTYLAWGLYDHGAATFYRGISRLPPGHCLEWSAGTAPRVYRYYDLPAEVAAAGPDLRHEAEATEDLRALLQEAVRLRFRADVPVGVCLSGGLDSSLLCGLIRQTFGPEAPLQAYHFVTGDPAYDELPWVRAMLEGTAIALNVVALSPEDVPALAEEVQRFEEEPFGGLPTLAMSRVYARARADGVPVLLDGQGLDEQWAGYDYYARELNGHTPAAPGQVQGTHSPARSTAWLAPEFAVSDPPATPAPFPDRLANARYRDLAWTKLPRALRFNDRASMMHSVEARAPFLDHRLVELAFRQPAERLMRGEVHKVLLRQVARDLLPHGVASAPKRPVQTPQREWLRGPLRGWVEGMVAGGELQATGWFRMDRLRDEWQRYLGGEGDSSFHVWQWVNTALALRAARELGRVAATAVI